MLTASPAVWHYRTYVIILLLNKLVPPSSYCAIATNSWESNLRFAKLRTMCKHRSLLGYTKATQASRHSIAIFAFSAQRLLEAVSRNRWQNLKLRCTSIANFVTAACVSMLVCSDASQQFVHESSDVVMLCWQVWYAVAN